MTGLSAIDNPRVNHPSYYHYYRACPEDYDDFMMRYFCQQRRVEPVGFYNYTNVMSINNQLILLKLRGHVVTQGSVEVIARALILIQTELLPSKTFKVAANCLQS